MWSVRKVMLCRLIYFLLYCVTASHAVYSQDAVPSIPITITSEITVRSLSAPAIVTPIVCGGDGSIYLRVLSLGTIDDLKGIAPDGRTVVTFRRTDIRDVSNPRPISFYVTDAAVYLLVNSLEQAQNVQQRSKTSRGETIETKAVTGVWRQVLAAFSHDGTFRNTIRLDVPIHIMQIAIFPNGDLLAAGIESTTGEPKLALVSSSGQFRRYIEFTEDVVLSDESVIAGKSQFGNAKASMEYLIGTSVLLPAGDNILLVRRNTNVPILEVSSGGAVKTIRVGAPKGFLLSAVFPSKSEWVVRFVKNYDKGACSL